MLIFLNGGIPADHIFYVSLLQVKGASSLFNAPNICYICGRIYIVNF